MYGLIVAVAQCEDLNLKYYEEMDKRKKLHNIVQETKGVYHPFLDPGHFWTNGFWQHLASFDCISGQGT